jgi:uncharacterized surface anchored protein
MPAMVMSSTRSLILAVTLFAMAPMDLDAQLSAKREAKVAESEKPRNVKGGTTFQVSVTYDKPYDGALNFLKRQGYTIDSAAADTGQIITAIDIKGGYSQTGTRIQVTCIKDDDAKTSVRVLVTEQKRKKLLQTEPWSDPKADEAESAKIADQIKAVIAN